MESSFYSIPKWRSPRLFPASSAVRKAVTCDGEEQARSDAETWPLCTDTKLNLRDRVLGEAEKNSFIAGAKLGVQGSWCLKDPNSPKAFREKFIKTGWGWGGYGVCAQLMEWYVIQPKTPTILIGWWWCNRASASSTFRFQPVCGLRACGQHTVKFFHLVEVSVSAKQLKGHSSEYYL